MESPLFSHLFLVCSRLRNLHGFSTGPNPPVHPIQIYQNPESFSNPRCRLSLSGGKKNRQCLPDMTLLGRKVRFFFLMSDSTERLGTLLFRMGALNQKQIDDILEYQKEHKDMRFGKIAITLGYVIPTKFSAF